MRLRVAPHPASSGFAGDRVFELPRPSCPSVLSKLKFRLPRSSFPRLRLLRRPPGFPGFRVFRPCRRWSFEPPRLSHPSAPLARGLQVSPLPRPSVAPADTFCGSPRFLHLPALSATEIRVASSRVLRCSWRWCFGLPLGSALQLPLPVRLRVAPHLSPSGFASGFFLRVSPQLPPLAPADGSPSCLGSRTFRLCRSCVSSAHWILHLRLGDS